MKIGNNIEIDILIDGTVKVDGGILFGGPKTQWETYTKVDRRNRVPTLANSLLVRLPESNVLLDAGVGAKRLPEMRVDYGFTRSRLPGALRATGLNARNVDIVAFSNLKTLNSGGATKLDRENAAVPTYRNATYLVQEAALDAAKSPGYRHRHAFDENDYGPLEDRDLLKYVNDGDSIATGITAKLMEGVAKGNQVFFIQYGSERLMYVGEVIPTRWHLELDHIQADADNPNRLLREKDSLIKQAIAEGWLMIFGRDPDCPAAYLQMRNGRLNLLPKAI